jgi:F0F1-type ATP synthase assembly protein I
MLRVMLFACNRTALWGRWRSMMLEFVDGILAAMLPSMLTVAWLVWRAA